MVVPRQDSGQSSDRGSEGQSPPEADDVFVN